MALAVYSSIAYLAVQNKNVIVSDLYDYVVKPLTDWVIANVWNPINQYILAPLSNLGNFLYNTVSQDLNYLTNMINNVYNFLGSISNGLMGIYNGIIGAFNSYVVAPIESFFSGALSFLSGIPSTLRSNLEYYFWYWNCNREQFLRFDCAAD